jgi:glycosyltransferase involved in cell wall biosynthesis
MKTPSISVPLLAYNHEKYVAEAIQSVLEQTFSDFELIIINDGSTDRTDEIIRSFKDDRIVYHSQANQGPVVASNNAIGMARGKYVAIICGDDAWYPNRLQRHYEALRDSRYLWAFSWVNVIDEDSQLIPGTHIFKEFYDRAPMNRAQIIRTTFFDGCPLHTKAASSIRPPSKRTTLRCGTACSCNTRRSYFRSDW